MISWLIGMYRIPPLAQRRSRLLPGAPIRRNLPPVLDMYLHSKRQRPRRQALTGTRRLRGLMRALRNVRESYVAPPTSRMRKRVFTPPTRSLSTRRRFRSPKSLMARRPYPTRPPHRQSRSPRHWLIARVQRQPPPPSLGKRVQPRLLHLARRRLRLQMRLAPVDPPESLLLNVAMRKHGSSPKPGRRIRRELLEVPRPACPLPRHVLLPLRAELQGIFPRRRQI